MHASAWVDWQLSDPATNWQTIRADHSKQTFSYAPRYYMHKTFTHALRPGSRVIDSDNSNTLAAIREDGSLVLVVLNTSGSAAKYSFDLSKFDAVGSKVKVHRFTLPAALNADADISVTGKSFEVNVGAQSIVTMVVESVKGEGQCVTDSIVPYVKIHDGGWNETTDVTVNPGDSLVIGPHPWDGGRWVWRGPNDFYQVGREVRFKNMQWQSSGIYKATFNNGAGCESIVSFKVVVNDPDHPYVEPVEPDTTQDTTAADTVDQAIRVVNVPALVSVTRLGNDLQIIAPARPMTLTIHDLQGVLLLRRQINGPTIVPVGQFSRNRLIVRLTDSNRRPLFLKTIR